MTDGAGPDVTIWLGRPAQWSEQKSETTLLPWLDMAERRRWQDFVFAHDRHTYLVAHGLLRWGLSAAAPGIAPQAWRFQADRLGRPSLIGPDRAASSTFSLSHTRGMTAAAIGAGGALGIDVEAMRDPADAALAAAASAFAPDERRWLEQQPRRAAATLRLWTLKEAYAKARGLGLHLPLDSFAFLLDSHRGVQQFLPPADEPAGTAWHFLEAAPGGCRLALAYRAPALGIPLRVQIGMQAPGWTPRRTLLLQHHGNQWRRC